jgi:hypothetical protein
MKTLLPDYIDRLLSNGKLRPVFKSSIPPGALLKGTVITVDRQGQALVDLGSLQVRVEAVSARPGQTLHFEIVDYRSRRLQLRMLDPLAAKVKSPNSGKTIEQAGPQQAIRVALNNRSIDSTQHLLTGLRTLSSSLGAGAPSPVIPAEIVESIANVQAYMKPLPNGADGQKNAQLLQHYWQNSGLWLETRLATQLAALPSAELARPVSSWRQHPGLQDILTRDLKANIGRLDGFFQQTPQHSVLGQLLRSLELPDLTADLLREVQVQQKRLMVQSSAPTLDPEPVSNPAGRSPMLRQCEPLGRLLGQLDQTLARWQAQAVPSQSPAVVNALKDLTAFMQLSRVPGDATGTFSPAPATQTATPIIESYDASISQSPNPTHRPPPQDVRPSTTAASNTDNGATCGRLPAGDFSGLQRFAAFPPDGTATTPIEHSLRQSIAPALAIETMAPGVDASRVRADDVDSKPAVVFPRALKQTLLNLVESVDAALAKKPAQPELLLRMQQLTSELLGFSESTPQVETKVRDSMEPVVGLACNLVLKDSRQKASFKIYYPTQNKDSAKSCHHVALLLNLDRLGAVQVDFKLAQNNLAVEFVVAKDRTKQLLEAQLGAIAPLLKNRFSSLVLRVEIERRTPSASSHATPAQAVDDRMVDVRA